MTEIVPIEEEDPQESTSDEKYAVKIPWTAIDWTMKWGPQYPNKPATEPVFEDGPALAVLLAYEVVFLNSFWWNKDWPEAAKKKTSLSVNCSDVFAWGCSDAEDLDYAEIEDLWIHWKQDKDWGPAVWCMKKRGQMPQNPVLARIIAGGIWDVDKLRKDLKVNYYDTVSRMMSDAKYKAYCDWCVEVDKEQLPRNKDWWMGWKEYTTANPKWHELEWNKIINQQVDEFRAEYNRAAPTDPITVVEQENTPVKETLISRILNRLKLMFWNGS